MATITELKNTITESVIPVFTQHAFSTDLNPIFYRHNDVATWMLSVTFLNRQQASYFSSNTASFGLETGIFFQKQQAPDRMRIPSVPECHLRGNVLRRFKQKHPLKAERSLGWFHPEYKRRDVWWVDREGENLKIILEKLPFHIERYGLPWLDTFSDPDYVQWYLRKKKEQEPYMEGPFDIGNKKSPARADLIKSIKHVVNPVSV